MSAERFVNAGVSAMAGKFGWGILLSWLFCTFYTGVATPSVNWIARMMCLPAGLTVIFEVVPLITAILSIMALIALERQHAAILNSRALPWLGAVLCAVGTVLAFSLEVVPLVSLIGVVCTGIGSSVLWMLWGSYYTRIESEKTETYACISAVMAAVLVFVVSLLPGEASLIAVSVMPLLSGCFLVLARRDATAEPAVVAAQQHDALANTQTQSVPQAGHVALPLSMWKSAAVLCIMYAFISLLGQLGVMPSVTSAGFRVAIVISGAFIAIIGAVSMRGPRRFSVPFLLRWMTPLLVVGFAAIIVFGDQTGARIAFNVSGAGRLGFCLVAQIYFSRFADEGFATAIQAYGIGWLSVHVGDFLGMACGFVLPVLAAQGVTIAQMAGVAIVLVAFTALIPFGADGVFQVDRPTEEGFSSVKQNELQGTQTQAAASMESGSSVAVSAPSEQFSPEEELAEDHQVSYEEKVAALAVTYGLTARETEIFTLLMQGRSVPYIRDKLVVSRDTVATHVKHIYAKTKVHSRQELLDLVHG